MENLEEKLEEKIGEALKVLHEIYPDYDNADEHNIKTPHRIAKMWIEMFKGLGEADFEFTTFKNESSIKEDWVILKDIEFSSMCQHHLLPFSGVVHIAYIPSDEICGISKLARVVDYFSARPQVQERLGRQIFNFIKKELDPNSLVVIVEAKHTCVACRGIKSRNSTMITTSSMYEEDVREIRELIK